MDKKREPSTGGEIPLCGVFYRIYGSEFFIFVETESTVCDSKKSRGTTAFVFFFKCVGGPRTSRRREASKRTDRVESFHSSNMSVRDATMRAALAASTAARSPHALRVHFSNRYVYAQIVRASDGHVVASASTIERGFDASTGTIGRPRGGWGPGHGFGGEAAKAAADAGSHAADARRVSRSDKRAAAYVGKTLAERAKEAEVERVRWNRPYGQRYHGKVRAVLEELVGGGIDVVGGKASKA